LNITVKIMMARLLLLCFVIVVIPLDLYHQHNYSSSQKNKQEINTSKGLSQSIFTSHCLACALHLDRQAFQETTTLLLSCYENTADLIRIGNQQAIYAGLADHFNLRGPPRG